MPEAAVSYLLESTKESNSFEERGESQGNMCYIEIYFGKNTIIIYAFEHFHVIYWPL